VRELRRRGEALPEALFVSGAPAPQVKDRDVSLSTLPDEELIAWLLRLDGTPADVLAHAEMMALMLPTLRADLALRDGYACAAEPALRVPIVAYGGEDDVAVGETGLCAWRDQTRERFTSRRFPGGHFFIRTAQRLVLRALSGALHELIAEVGLGEVEGACHGAC
jgi:medium-chain acyl-[acyl-carrier-protein] hydrolase